MKQLKKKIIESVNFLKGKVASPEVAIILGSGLGGMVEKIENQEAIPYSEIPNFPISTVKGHEGNLILGLLSQKRVVAMQGRFHYYEGYSMGEVTFPVRVFKMLGVKYLILSNAAGGVNPLFKPGDLMIIVDHINLMPENPLRGPNDVTLGPRFPSMHEPYKRDLIELAQDTALKIGIKLSKGVYVALQGPNLETPSEYRMIRLLGGDAVGMSTVPEVIVANHMGMKVIGFSIITNVGDPYDPKPASHEEVVKVASKAANPLSRLIEAILRRLV